MLKTIPDYPNYAITKDGQVWSKKNWKWLKLSTDKVGRVGTNLGKGCSERMCRLVLETFVGKCPVGMECRHLNGDPSDNKLKNLQWGTHKENGEDMKKHGRKTGFKEGSQHINAKLTDFLVRMIRNWYATKMISQRELAELFDVKQGTISYVTKRGWNHV